MRARPLARDAAGPVRSGDVFIHGVLPRAGTNYLSRVLRCHRDLAASPRELWEFPHLRKSDPLLSYASSMARSANLPRLEGDDLLRLIGDAWLTYASEGLPEGCRLVVKEPSVKNLERFFLFFPLSRLLVLMRDGRDIACSSLRTAFASPRGLDWRHPRSYSRVLQNPLAEMARRWSEASRTVRAFLEEHDEGGRVRVVRYEDLVRDPEAETRGILDFLELSPDRFAWDSFAALDVRGSSFVGNRSGKLDWNGAGSMPETFEPIGRWRSWGEREIRRFHSVAAAELDHWGYSDRRDPR
jgi:protein-tyrosine sulfotransferase